MASDEDFGFKELIIWRKAIDFSKNVINLVDNIKTEKKHYRITEQTEASATSVAANIAEGKGRFSRKEFKQYLFIARGSIYETITFLNIMKELGWLTVSEVEIIEKEGLMLNKMLNSLINKLETD